MNLRDKKLFLLHRLSQEIEPITLGALLPKLSAEYSERTVRSFTNRGFIRLFLS